ncbi:MAG: malectin domain-containing carbohydrate-binding protein, partial [Candidatus Brocadiia bacterium]
LRAPAAGPNPIMLSGAGSPVAAREATNIPVGRTCDVLYFLHVYNPGPALRDWQRRNRRGKARGEPPLEPPTLFRYVIRYGDGETVPVNVRWGEAANDWLRAGPWADPPHAPTAWRQTANPKWVMDRWPRRGEHLALYAMRFENPRPQQRIAALDMVSANDAEHDWGAPALLAVSTGARERKGRTYYVAPDGDDAGPGTFARPWATPYKAAATLRAGDTAYLRGGSYMLRTDWQEVISIAHSGEPGAPITLAAYPGETAVLDGDAHHCAHDTRVPYAIFDRDRGLLNVFEKSHVTIRNLRVRNSRKSGMGIYQSDHILLDHNVVYGTYMCAMNTAGNAHFRIVGNTLGKNCSVYYRYDHDTQQWQPWKPEDGKIHVGGREAIDNHRNEHTEIAFNEIYWCNKEGIADPGRHFKIHHNYIHHLEHRPELYWPSGIYLDAYGPIMDDLEVYANVIHDAAGGISIGSEGGTLATDIRVHHNLIFDNTWEAIGMNSAGGNGPRRNIVIENNTCLRCGHTPWEPGPTGGILLGTDNCEDITVRYNILTDNRDYQVAINGGIDRVAQRVAIHQNLYDPVFLPTERVRRRIWGWVPVVSDRLIWGDPGFRDAEAWDFRLEPDSPAVDVVASARDEDGSAGDLGAFPIRQTLPPLPAEGTGLALRISAGSDAPYTDPEGRTWQADRRLPRNPKPGDWGCTWSRTVERSARPISGTEKDALYLTERYGMERYRFLIGPGLYVVRLHFAETWHDEPGRREFTVLLNRRKVLEHFDPAAAAGGVNAAVVREFEVPVYSKGLTVEFVAEKDNPLINAVEVIQATR